MSNGHANHIIFDVQWSCKSHTFDVREANNQGPVISKCYMQHTNVTEDTGNLTETEKQGSVLNPIDPGLLALELTLGGGRCFPPPAIKQEPLKQEG